MNQEQFQKHVLDSLTNIEAQQILIKDKLVTLERKVVTLGRANCQAYSMTKEVINELAKHQESVNEDLSDAMGTVRNLSWHHC
jgi:ribosomal silencing factor RsfS